MDVKSPSTPAPRKVFTVSQLNRAARQLLETHFALLWVEGEISNFVRPSSGHWYFTLKDGSAQVKCAMFANRNSRVRKLPQNGQKVVLRARVSLYEGRGDYQLIAEHLEEAGAGDLQQAFEALKSQLQQEGLFDSAIKQSLPTLPQHIGVITSPTGAAIRDILTVLKRRFPSIPVTVIPVPVQGTDAAPAIAHAIELANATALFDVLIVGRGGGSLEDLWPFNEERVARAIYASAVPIVSAVGHETDVTIADFVADVRAPTPSAAAELISPDRQEWLNVLRGYEQTLNRQITQHIHKLSTRLQHLRSRVRHPGHQLRQQAQTVDQFEVRLLRAIKAVLTTKQSQCAQVSSALKNYQPKSQIKAANQQLGYLNTRLKQAARRLVKQKQQQLGQVSQRLNTVSPLNTLDRGYAILMDDKQNVIQHVEDAVIGDTLSARVSDGEVLATITGKRPLAAKKV